MGEAWKKFGQHKVPTGGLWLICDNFGNIQVGQPHHIHATTPYWQPLPEIPEELSIIRDQK